VQVWKEGTVTRTCTVNWGGTEPPPKPSRRSYLEERVMAYWLSVSRTRIDCC